MLSAASAIACGVVCRAAVRRGFAKFFRAVWAAGNRAFRKAVLDHRRAGVPMVFWKDGKIVHVPADQVPLPEVED